MHVQVEYYKRDKFDSFEHILNVAKSAGAKACRQQLMFFSEVDSVHLSEIPDRIAILTALASYYTNIAAKQKDSKLRGEYFDQATALFNRADKIDIRQAVAWVGKGENAHSCLTITSTYVI